MAAKWGGLNQQEIYADWADALGSFSIGAINYGLEMSRKGEFPPSQGEFLKHCQQYRPADTVSKLEHKLTPEQIESNRARIAEIARNLANRNKIEPN